MNLREGTRRLALSIATAVLVSVAGCKQPVTNPPVAKAELAQGEGVPSGSTQPSKSLSDALSNERLKRIEDRDAPIENMDGYVNVDGMWTPESSDPKRALIFQEQVRISCDKSENVCRGLTVTLAPAGGMVIIMGPEEKEWPIISWDARGLLASYGPEVHAAAASDRCHSHVLTMTFRSGAVSTSDIPTHEKGCEEFSETDSYRLARGQYYVDTSPANDMDHKPNPKK